MAQLSAFDRFTPGYEFATMLISILNQSSSNPDMLQQGYRLIANLAQNSTFGSTFMDNEGLQSIMAGFTQFGNHADVIREACHAIAQLATNDNIRQKIVDAGVLQALLGAVTTFGGNALVLEEV